MTRAVLAPVDRWAGRGPDFNAQAAEVIYKAMTSMDDESALMFGRIIVADGILYDLIAHHAEVQKAAVEVVGQRADMLRRRYTREAVAKARRGEDTSPELRVLVELGKAFDFTEQQHPRDALGRFVQSHTPIVTDASLEPIDQARAKKVYGVPRNDAIGGNTLSHYQQAHQQITDLLSPFTAPDLNPLLHLQVRRYSGNIHDHVVQVDKDGKPADFSQHLKPGDRIMSAAVSVAPRRDSVQSATFDALAAAGMPRVGGHVTTAMRSGAALSPSGLRGYNEERAKAGIGENEVHSPTNRAFGRLESGSKLLQQSIGPAAPRSVQYALAVANHVGQFGPEAQKVIGPSADRMAYRYRGTERRPSAAMVRAFADVRNDPQLQGEPAAARRKAAIEGIESDTGEGWDPGPVLAYFRNRLPNPDLNELQRRSGVIPPSEGVIIDRNGNIAAQASGFADDWYLPFNLKHLAALKGGEYIRTRTFGGPTTEDIYTGLVSGARAITVVSHSGVYSINFDRNFKGGRRFNDKAARMVGRYGHLLDALRSNQVKRGDISFDRMEELHAEAAQGPYGEPDEDSPEHQREFNRLMDKERKNPKMSQADKEEAARGWLDSMAARVKTADGRPMTARGLINDRIASTAKQTFQADAATTAAYGAGPAFSMDAHRTAAADKLLGANDFETATKIAAADGRTVGFQRHMDEAERANKQRVQSLALNGRGYYDGLQALQEQFPYYMDPPVFHEWRGSQGLGVDRGYASRKDTGYVAPRHNRPSEVESGYFNEQVTGHGKVAGNTTRYQNFGVHGGKPKPVPGEGGAAEKLPDGTTPAASTPPRRNGVRVGGDDVWRQRNKSDAELQVDADVAMVQELRSQVNFKPNVSIGGIPFGGPNETIATEIANDKFPDKEIQEFFKAKEEELVDRAKSPEQAAKLRNTMDRFIRMGVFKVDDDVLYRYENKGKIAEAKAMPSTVRLRMAELKEDHDFPGLAFDPKRSAEPGVIAEAYDGDKGINHLRETLGLPGIETPTDDYVKKAEEIRDTLKRTDNEHNRGADAGRPPSRDEVAALDKTSLSLMRATQLQRRYRKAVAARPPTPIPGPPDNRPDVEDRLAVMTPEELADLLRRARPGVNDSNVIEGSSS